METFLHYINLIVNNPLYLGIVAVLFFCLFFSFFKKLLKIFLVVLLVFVLFLAYLTYTGQEVPQTKKQLVEFSAQQIKKAVNTGGHVASEIGSTVKEVKDEYKKNQTTGQTSANAKFEGQEDI